jgi:lipopolysaccharide export system protein LptA
VAVLPSGSRLTGPDVVYLRVVPNSRPFEEMTAINKPTVTIVSAGDTAKTVTLNANTIYMRGDSLTYASRNVIIVRNDMVAHGDSAFLDGRTDHETIRLMFKPKVQGTTGRKFELEGDIVDAYSKSKKLERVVARGNARATSRDLEITSDTIDLRMSNDYLEHAFAWSHPGLAKAKSPGQSIVADSIDVTMPKQRVQVVRAFRRAFAQADADSTKFRTTEKDWLSGDTVVAWFDSAATTKDTNATPPLKQILATHVKDSARAYYHLVATDTAAKVPAIGYVRGREIQLDFDDHKIGRIAVRDSVAGIYLEPRHDTASTTTKGKANAKPQTKPPTKPPTTTPPKKPPVELPEPRQRPDLAGGRPRDSFLS